MPFPKALFKLGLGTRAPMVLPDGPNQRWSLDFVSDTLTCAYSDEAGHLFRHEAGHRTDLKPATIPI